MGGEVKLRAHPFMRVEHDAVGLFHTCPERAEFFTKHRRARPSRIDMGVKLMRGGDIANGRYIIAGACACAACAGDDASGEEARGKIGFDGGVEFGGVHGAHRALRWDADKVLLSDARDPDRAVNGGVHLLGGIDAQAGLACKAPLVASPVEGFLAHGEHGGQRRAAGAVLDDTVEGLRKAERIAQPVHHACLHLGGGRRGLPEHTLWRHHCCEEVGQHGSGGGVGREVGKEAWVLPVGDAGHNDALEILDYILHRLALFWGGCGELCRDFARLCLGAYGALSQGAVILCGPIGHIAAPFWKICPAHLRLPLLLTG